MSDFSYDEPRLKRWKWVILAAILLIGWFSLKDIVYRSVITQQNLPAMLAATYNSDEAWAVLPVETPSGAWEDPWGIDLFIVPPPSGAVAGKGLVGAFHEPTKDELVAISHDIERNLALAGPSYAAIYRHPSASATSQPSEWDVAREDIALAFEQYLYSKNNMRGILVIASPDTEALIEPILRRVETDPRLLERFSGVVVLQDKTKASNIRANCSPALEGDCLILGKVDIQSNWTNWLAPQLPRKSKEFTFKEGSALEALLAKRNTKLSIWLDKYAPKPAEPLGGIEDIEVVDVAPIRRPGETDEDAEQSTD